MKIFSDKQLTIKEIWLVSLRLYYKTLPHIWPIAAFMGALVIMMAFIGSRASCQVKIGDIKTISQVQAICFSTHIVVLLLLIYLGGVIFHKIYLIGNEKNATLYTSFIFIGKKYFKIASSILVILFACVLGTFAFIAPGIFLFVLLLMVQPLILFDDKGFFAAFKGSCMLVWGNWWRTFVVIFPLLFFNYLMSFVSQFVSNRGYWWFMIVGVSLIIAFIYPLFYSCILMQFGDLKLRHQKRLRV